MDAQEVKRLALAWRVHPAADYHGRQHHVKWDDVVFALQTCYYVAPDTRNPGDYVAFGQLSATKKARVDFRVGEDDQGNVILVVTAFPYEPPSKRK